MLDNLQLRRGVVLITMWSSGTVVIDLSAAH